MKEVITYEYSNNSATITIFGTVDYPAPFEFQITKTSTIGTVTNIEKMAFDPTNVLHVNARLDYCNSIYNEKTKELNKKIDDFNGKLIPIKCNCKQGWFK